MRQLWMVLMSAGCLGTRGEEPGWVGQAEPSNEVEVTPCGGGDTGTVESGFAISGVIEDLQTGEVPETTEGLCAFALDPTPVLSGGEAAEMGGSQVCDNGEYYVGNLSDPPSVGMFISIADCDDTSPTIMKSATGVDFDDVTDLGDGDEHTNHTAYMVTLEYGAVVNEDFTGYDGNAVETGFMAGFVMDVDKNYVSDASLSCSGCADFYYLDTDPSDGMFATGETRNTKTDAAARAVFFAPAAPIFTYKADDGGSHNWEPQLFGSLPGYASFLLFDATN